MMKRWTRALAALCAVVLLLGLLPMGALAAGEEHTVWIVGDSTVCHYDPKTEDVGYYYKRMGYGDKVGEYLAAGYTVQNLALSGRSSKSFLAENNYTTLKNGIGAGDILIIGFGHNDEKTDDRYTDPKGDWQTEGSFAKSLYDNYVKLAQDKGATAVLCTPIVRHPEVGKTWSNNSLHIANGGNYAQAVIDLGKDTNTAVVDLTALTKALYEQLDAAEANSSTKLHAWTQDKVDTMDGTHINKYGAKWVAYTLAKDIVNSADSNVSAGLKAAFTLTAGEPTAADLADAATQDWTPPDYTAPDLPAEKSAIWPDYVAGDTTFYGTAFGSLGGNPATANYTLGTDEQGNMQFVIKNMKGKVSGTEEGFLMYFVPVPAGKSFTLRATATFDGVVDGATYPEQAAFGLMARDAIWIDKNDKALKSDYVAAGTFADGSANCFRRKAGALEKPAALGAAPVEGESYELSIVGTSDGYTCTFGDNAPQSGGYDFALTTMDTDYIYVGMFTARSISVTFSNISLVIEGGGETPDNPDNPDNPPKPMVPVVVDGAVAGGGLETIFAQIADVTDADVTAVKWSGDATGELTGDDLEYLVRDVDGGVRIDIPGVKAGTYTLTVTAKGEDYTAEDIEVKAHDRSGFAHQTVDESGACTPYTGGVGAYNDDGTLKDNALVLYVTEENKETISVTASNGTVITGIGNILNAQGAYKSAKYLLNLQQPLVIRIIGDVTKPAGTTEAWGTGNGGAKDDAGGMCVMSYAGNVTIEGIGPDATVNGWGFCLDAGGTGRNADGNKRAGHGENCEIRNLNFRNVPEDCIGIKGEQKSKDGVAYIDSSAEHIWIHNNSFYGPKGLPDQSKDKDKSEGDGAVDFRQGEYMTLSYNCFDDYHKTSLIGSDDDNLQYHITWHHNHWKNVHSRAPLARQADIHIYNNLYEGQRYYCMSLRANTYIFSEYNTFLDCTRPVWDDGTGGVCKSYQDVFENCTENNDATIVTDKTQTVTSANLYANFDTAAGSYVAQGKYLLDTDDRGQANIEAWGGVLKAADKMTTVPMTVLKEDDSVAVTGITLNKTTASVDEDETVSITATVTPDEATDKSVNWSSSNEAVATVDANGKVTGKKAGKATITATTNNGGLTATCVVTVIAANPGSIKRPSPAYTIPPGTTKPDETKPGDTTPAADVAETYGDVEAGSWYASGVQFVVDKKLFIGVSDRSFAPAMSMSRAMVMTVLARVDGKEPATKAGEPWYSGAMDWAVTAGISDGTNPEVDVTLEQFATMLYRYAVDKKLADAVEADLTGVPDADQVSDWAAQAITWAKAQGILQGDQAGKLNPQNNASRAQAAVIMERFVEKCVK